MDADAYNEEHVATRRVKDISAVIDEIHTGFAADFVALEHLSESDLNQLMRNARGEMMDASRLLNFHIGAHNHGHMDDIEGALARKVGA
jgi:hypothetical protein